MASLLNIGVSGLVSHQSALSTVGNNITNANVEGYSRQEAVFGARASQRQGESFVGSGVELTTVRRITDQFTIQRLQDDLTRSSSLNVLSSGYAELDDLISNPNTGLAGVLDSMFAAFQSASETPTSPQLREGAIGEAERFVSRYNDINSYLETTRSLVNENISGIVTEVNRIAESLAAVNQTIRESTLQGGASPSDLLDSRDQLLRDLSEKINFNSVSQDGTTINVYLSTGQALVLGETANTLVAVDGAEGANSTEVAISVEGGVLQRVTDGITGGELGGQIRFRSEGIDPIANEVGLLATVTTNALNVINAQGVDLDQQPGQDFFTSINDRAAQLGRVTYSPQNSSATAVASVEINDARLLTASDYRLEFTGGGGAPSYTLTRLSDGVQVQQGVIGATLPQTITAPDGFSIELEAGSFTGGDSLTITPSRLPAENVEVLLQAQSLAFALPISVSKNGSNQGTGSIIQPVSNSIGALLAEQANGGTATTDTPLLIRFTSSTTFDVLDNSDPDNPVALAPPVTGLSFVPGRTNTVFEANTAIAPGSSIAIPFDIQISGVPQAGDEFSVNPGFPGEGDNGNALAFASLRDDDLLATGGSLIDIYASTVATLGVRAAGAEIDSAAADSLLVQSEQRLQSESGVNLDEEAARLIQYEQAYNASAQVISVARAIFDSLLAAFR